MKIFISLLIASVAAEQVSRSCTTDLASDDATVLLQNQVDLKPAQAASRSESTEEAEPAEGFVSAIISQVKKESMMEKAFAEFVAMTLFVFIGCGSAMAMANQEGSAWVFQVALTFGLAITCLAYSIGHISGGQINCAVTFALVITGHVGAVQGVVNLTAQLVGSILGSLLTTMVFDKDSDRTGGAGTNGLQPKSKSATGEKFSWFQALVGEVMGTFILVYTVFETAVDKGSEANRALACTAIGISVFLAHSVLIAVDGCSINPTRTFGPAVVHSMFYEAPKEGGPWADMWIFWVGPLTGAALAAGVYSIF